MYRPTHKYSTSKLRPRHQSVPAVHSANASSQTTRNCAHTGATCATYLGSDSAQQFCTQERTTCTRDCKPFISFVPNEIDISGHFPYLPNMYQHCRATPFSRISSITALYTIYTKPAQYISQSHISFLVLERRTKLYLVSLNLPSYTYKPVS